MLSRPVGACDPFGGGPARESMRPAAGGMLSRPGLRLNVCGLLRAAKAWHTAKIAAT